MSGASEGEAQVWWWLQSAVVTEEEQQEEGTPSAPMRQSMLASMDESFVILPKVAG